MWPDDAGDAGSVVVGKSERLARQIALLHHAAGERRVADINFAIDNRDDDTGAILLGPRPERRRPDERRTQVHLAHEATRHADPGDALVGRDFRDGLRGDGGANGLVEPADIEGAA